MKKLLKYIVLVLLLVGALPACIKEKDPTAADLGLSIKTFFPTKVVAGQPMTINGNGLADVTEIVFPGAVTVTSFEHVGGEMIRVKAPAGIAAEGGKIVVRTAADAAESSASITLGHTVISGYSKAEGAQIEGGEILAIYGTDLEFISAIELMDTDGNPLVIGDAGFYRKGTSEVKVTIPRKTIFEGTFSGKVFTVDEQHFDMPALAYKPASDGGYWQTVKKPVWTNDDPAGHGPVNWSGQYRFALEGHDTNSEAIACFSEEVWNKLMTETFYLNFKPDESFDAYQIRITDGWWTSQWRPDDPSPSTTPDEIIDNGDGTYHIAINISSNPDYVAVLEVQHLLITGVGYVPLEIYFEEEEWVEGGHWETVRNAFWTNADPATNGPVNWSGQYRFALEGHDANSEAIACFPEDIWNKVMTEKFYLSFKPDDSFDSYQIRITDGWWTSQWRPDDPSPSSTPDEIIDDGDGTYHIAIDISSNPDYVAVLEVQHLLITGVGYVPLALYFEEEVFVPSNPGPKEVDVWVNEDPAGKGPVNWSGQYRFALEGHDANGEAIACFREDVWNKLMTETFYLNFKPDESFDAYQIRITDGWWTSQWRPDDPSPSTTPDEIIDDGDGTYHIAINISSNPDYVAVLEVQHLLVTGVGYVPLKLYFLE